MNILFISYSDVSLRRGRVRVVAMLRALADAGHNVDLVAPTADLPEHAQIRIYSGTAEKPMRRHHVRVECMAATGRVSYDAVHAVDDAVFFAARLCRWKKKPLVYDAARRFTGKAADPGPGLWKWFPTYFQRLEARVLERAALVLSSCTVLTGDLLSMSRELSVAQIPDIPAQSLYARHDREKFSDQHAFGTRPGVVVVCSLIPVNASGIRLVLMAARKVIDSMPEASFFFQGIPEEEAAEMATNLDISERCIFLDPQEPEHFLARLEEADALLMVLQGQGRYIDEQVYTFLQAGAPLVAVQDHAYDEVLTDKTAVRVLLGADNMAEGVLRAIREPLFSMALATEAQQLVADHYTYSSFKHKVRMAYHQLNQKT